ncbi:MAG: DUF3576 domain-containing protein, partial [Pseudomonadota bacterium]
GGTPDEQTARVEEQRQNVEFFDGGQRTGFFDLFTDPQDDRRIGVNRYLWAASLDTLSILPIEGADPFSGVITTGWGRVNGASQPYRVTVYITEPALEARSLRVAVFRQSGGRAVAVSDEIAKEIENAILTRARQIRVAEVGRAAG